MIKAILIYGNRAFYGILHGRSRDPRGGLSIADSDKLFLYPDPDRTEEYLVLLRLHTALDNLFDVAYTMEFSKDSIPIIIYVDTKPNITNEHNS